MKINKIVGIAVASLGIVFSVTTAAALYTKAATDTGFGIGAGNFVGSNGAVTYKINGATSGAVAPTYVSHDGEHSDGTGLVKTDSNATTFDQVHYVFTLSADYAVGLNEQSYVAGNLSISITNIPSKYQGKLAVWVCIEDYVADSYGKVNYEHAFMNSDYSITNEHTSYSANQDIVVASSGVQKLSIYLKYDLTTFADVLALDEESLGYSLSVTWGAASNGFTNKAFVVGDGNQWTDNEDYVMVPNIGKANSEGLEYIYNNLPGAALGRAKCHKPSGDVWSNGADTVLASEKTYDVYWNGSGSSAANFDDQ